MAELWTVIATALVSFAVAYFAYWLSGKPRLIVFSPNSTAFQLDPLQEGAQPLHIRAGQVIVQNAGRKSATQVQVMAQPGPRPWGYNIVPNVGHSIRHGARGEWLLEFPYVGPGETITVQILNGPNIDSVRSAEGTAKVVQVIHQRVFPKWLSATIWVLVLTGFGTVVYTALTLILDQV
jgi:hypothetical protein